MAEAGDNQDNVTPTTTTNGFPIPDPWTVRIKVLNKEEVILKKAGWFAGTVANATMSEEAFATKVATNMCDILPKKLKEMINLKLSATHVKSVDNLMVLKFQIEQFDFGALIASGMSLSPEEGQAFADMFDKLVDQFAAMDMPEKVPEIRGSVSTKIRNNMMAKLEEKIPEAMKEQDVLVECEIPEFDRNPPPEPVKPKMTALETPFILHASNIDRKKLLNENIKGPGKFVKKAIAKRVNEDKFNAKISEKLTGVFPEALKKGAGLGVKAVQMEERQKAEKAIVVQITIYDYSIPALIRMAKGDEFGKAFEFILECLKTFGDRFGVPGMQEKHDNVLLTIQTKVRDTMKEKLCATLSEKLFCTCIAED